MTFANVGTLEVAPGAQSEVVSIMTRHNPDLGPAECLLYEVGTSDERPDTVFVTELWTSAEAHQQSLQLPSARALIAEAIPLLSGAMDGHEFEVAGSPL